MSYATIDAKTIVELVQLYKKGLGTFQQDKKTLRNLNSVNNLLE